MTEVPYHAKLIIASSSLAIGPILSEYIITSCTKALASHDVFTIALSGGSVPTFVSELPNYCTERGIDPQWSKWHVLLADERCVIETHDDSNLGLIRSKFTNHVPIPKSQVYGIDESLLHVSTEAVASAYEETVLKPLLQLSGGKIDCVILGFGPDGHTCSLFPNHPLLHNDELRFVAHIDDSPKPPMSRITLTLPVLNKYSRNIIFCGAGSSKQPILNAVFKNPTKDDDFVQYAKVDNFSFIHLGVNYNWSFPQYDKAIVEMVNPAPFPCGMVRPEEGERGNNDRLVWIVDNDAFPH